MPRDMIQTQSLVLFAVGFLCFCKLTSSYSKNGTESEKKNMAFKKIQSKSHADMASPITSSFALACCIILSAFFAPCAVHFEICDLHKCVSL